MNSETYYWLKEVVTKAGYADEISWAENIKPCENPLVFWMEYSWVILNSGMKNTVARKIWDRILEAYPTGKRASDVFGHKQKAAAIDWAWEQRYELFNAYGKASDKLSYLQSLPWIGPITKYHLAKNLGVDCCKPDRHLQRISALEGTSPEIMCSRISAETGDRVAVIDTVLWRAAAIGFIAGSVAHGDHPGGPLDLDVEVEEADKGQKMFKCFEGKE